MPGRVFINYRRSISEVSAKRLRDALAKAFGDKGVFLDTSGHDGGAGLKGGEPWIDTLEREVDDSSSMVVLIDRGWADVVDDKGTRRLHDPHDFVRFEISRALTRGIPVLPVLLNDATMPRISELPPNLQQLTFAQAMGVSEASEVSFDADAARVAERLQQMISTARRSIVSWRRTIAVAIVTCAAGLIVGVLMPRQEWILGEDARIKDLRTSNASLERNGTDLQREITDAKQLVKRRTDEIEGQKGTLEEQKSEIEKLKKVAEEARGSRDRVIWLETVASPAQKERIDAIARNALEFIGAAERTRSGPICLPPETAKQAAEFAEIARVYRGSQQTETTVRLALAAAAAGDAGLLKEILSGADDWPDPFRRGLQTWLKEHANNRGSVDGVIWKDGPAAKSLSEFVERFSAQACPASAPPAVPLGSPAASAGPVVPPTR